MYSPAAIECLIRVPASRDTSREQSNAYGRSGKRFGNTSRIDTFHSAYRYGPAIASGDDVDGLALTPPDPTL
jgi:hypothetical protein